jgi:hypothetical protein
MAIDLKNINPHYLLTHCDDLCTKNAHEINNTLLSYLAWSNREGFDFELCYDELFNRVAPEDASKHNIYKWEHFIFARKFKLININNKAYEIAIKKDPTVKDLEEFSMLDPCFANLYPIKWYILDHLQLIPEYKGMLPFGREVLKYYNTIVPPERNIKGSPTYKDHAYLRDISLRKSILTGMPMITINNLMYWFGKEINSTNQINDDEVE